MSKEIQINNKDYFIYATVEDADDYFVAKYGSEWSTIPEEQKKQLLVSSTREIDSRDYLGSKVDENQPLKFPRNINGGVSDDNLLLMACCEMAENIYSSGGASSSSDENIKRLSLGDATIEFNSSVDSTVSDAVDKYLSDYLIGGLEVIL